MLAARRLAVAPKTAVTARRRGMASFAIREALNKQVAEFPTRNALRVTHQNVRWNSAQLRDHSGAVASGLLEAGLAPGKGCVGVAMGSTVEHVTVLLGAGSAGLKVASATTTEGPLSKDAMDKLLKEQKCGVLVISPDQIATVYELAPELRDMKLHESVELSVAAYPELKYVLHTGKEGVPGMHRFKDMLVYNQFPDMLSEVAKKDGADAPFLVAVDPKSGAAKETLTQAKALKEASSAVPDMSNADTLLLTAKDGLAVKMALGSLACVANNAQFIVPGNGFDEEALAKAKEEDKIDAELK